jgi:hypothetical protein
MTAINDAYINSLLADAAYVNGLSGLSGDKLYATLINRMTPALARFISDNFTVVTQADDSSSGFDAVVWQGKADTVYANKTYVSMRGTELDSIEDVATDVDLTSTGLAHAQLVSMVNWWLRVTTPKGKIAQQIKIEYRDSDVVSDGQSLTMQDFVAAPGVQGTGELAGISSIASVDGHSLGGYLATAFVRLFGSTWQVGSLDTYNSAGFSRLAASNIENGFSQIVNAIGTNYGSGTFVSTQNNFYAENGPSVTTNEWDPVGFSQKGVRIGLFQEESSLPTDNHSLYKLTDMLSLGNALALTCPL